MNFCKTRHCRNCRKILGIRGKCKNRYCELSPYYEYKNIELDIRFGVRYARLVKRGLKQ